MAAFNRHLLIVLPAVLAGALAGCITITNYEDLPPAPLDLTPPQPISTALPPMAPAHPTTSAVAETPMPARSPLADMILGRTPPSPPPPKPSPSIFPAGLGGTGSPGLPTPGRTNTPPFQPLELPKTHAPAPVDNSGAEVAPAVGSPSSTATIPLTFRQIIALQTLLDRQNFSCNCADGKIGSRTSAALRAFQKARGLLVTGEPNAATLTALGDLGAAFTSYPITAADHAQLTQNPATWLGKSQVAQLGYPTILEAVAERAHASQQAIRDLNPQIAVWPDPPAGTTLTIPDVGISEKLPRAARIRIFIGNKLVCVFNDTGQQVAQFPCSIAHDPAKREPCEITVAVIAPHPNYTFDPALFSDEPESATIKTKLIIPAGPRNPVGVAWIGLSKAGYGIHGTPRPEDIGKTESHGCFRLANWNAQKLLRMVDIGTPVSVEE